LASGQQETGTWATNIAEPTAGPQVQAEAAISFPVRLKTATVVKPVYRNAKESNTPLKPCLGNVNQPVAEPGFLCIYRGEPNGGLETMDKNAAFFGITDPKGNFILPTEKVGALGALVVFRTGQFSEEEAGTTLTEPAYLSAAGSWAVTEK